MLSRWTTRHRRLPDFLDNRIGKISAHRKANWQWAGGIEDRGGDVLIVERAAALEGHTRYPRKFGDLVGRTGQDAPVGRLIMIQFPRGLKNRRCIELRVE